VERLNKWSIMCFVPPSIIFFLGWVALALGQKATVIVWIAVSLPIVWCAVAALFILNLRPDGRYNIKGTFQPHVFFVLWAIFMISTWRLLPYFPCLGNGMGTPSVEFVKVINVIHLIIIIVVAGIFFYQCEQDKRKNIGG